MKARILKPEEEPLWEKFIADHPLATVHQHPAWGHFQAKVPSRGKYWIVVLEEEDKIVGGSLIIRQCLPKGFSWLYAARGPLLQYSHKDINDQVRQLVRALKTIAKSQKAIFIRIDPPIPKNHKFPALKGFKASKYGFQPEHTLIIDITESEEKILAQMKPKGRYNIRLSDKKGVKVFQADPRNPKDFQQQIHRYHEILAETTTRDGFHGHDLNFYKNMVETLSAAKTGTLYLAEYEGKIIAGLIATYFGDTATYYYGASSNDHRNVMAPYALQWQAIQDAKKAGYKNYDFLGIAASDDLKDPWHGITQFKKKFGGQHITYHKAHEHPFKPFLYLAYKLYKALLAKK